MSKDLGFTLEKNVSIRRVWEAGRASGQAECGAHTQVGHKSTWECSSRGRCCPLGKVPQLLAFQGKEAHRPRLAVLQAPSFKTKAVPSCV